MSFLRPLSQYIDDQNARRKSIGSPMFSSGSGEDINDKVKKLLEAKAKVE